MTGVGSVDDVVDLMLLLVDDFRWFYVINYYRCILADGLNAFIYYCINLSLIIYYFITWLALEKYTFYVVPTIEIFYYICYCYYCLLLLKKTNCR